MKYLLGSSFFDNGRNGSAFRREFAHKWQMNKLAWDPAPSRIVVISEGGSERPQYAGTDLIHLTGNLGHCHDLIEDRKPHQFSGWSASMVALAMMAYTDEADFIYCEEDCLTFGPVVQQLYADMGDGVMVFGDRHKSAPFMPCAQSLFLVRHKFIPTFVATYLALGGDRDRHNLGEVKFCKIAERFGAARIKRLSFGVDRERPLPWDTKIWYAQQFTPEELAELKTRGLTV